MRSPQLRPAPQAGLGLPDVRTLRVEVTPTGAVVVHGPAGRREVAGPGEVTRCVILDGAGLGRSARRTVGATDALGLFVAERPVLLVHLHEFVPRVTLDGRELRQTSGARAVAVALGLLLEPAAEHEATALRNEAARVLVSPPTVPAGRRAPALTCALVGGTLGLLSWAGGGSEVTVMLVLLGLLVLAPVVVGLVRQRRRFLALSRPPAPEDRTIVPTRLDEARYGGLARAQLQVGPDDVVLHDRGTEAWVLGPAGGGATRCLVGSDVVRLTDDDDHDLMVLDRRVWCPGPADESALLAACSAAGFTCETTALSVQRRDPVPILESADLHVDRLMTPWQQGGITALVPTAAFFSATIIVIGAVLAAAFSPWSWPLLVAAVLVDAGVLVSSWWVRRWSMQQRAPRERRTT